MSFQGPALSFTSLFGDGIKTLEHQNHIFPESGIVTCSIIESSRGSLICVPVTDGFSSDCDSYLTVTELGVQKETIHSTQNGTILLGRKISEDGMQEQHDDETGSRLFIRTQHEGVEDGTEVLISSNVESSNHVERSGTQQEDEETDSRLFVHTQDDTVEDASEVLLQSNGDCSNLANCIEEENDDEADNRLFVHMQHDLVDNGSEVLLQTNGESASPGQQRNSAQEDRSHLAEVTHPGSTGPHNKAEKKKGGWPKGKKRRKGPSVTAAPKAPATGYVLFLNKRRKQMQKSNPEMLFSDVTKKIGNEWSNLPVEEKKVYLKRAEEEKKRYRKELKEYQQSEAYQVYTEKKKKATEGRKDGGESIGLPIHDIEDEDSHQLYCAVCDQLFSSIHNKKEHLYGKQHLSNVTGAIHQVASSSNKRKSKGSQIDLDAENSTNSCEKVRLKDSVVSVSDAMDLLISLSRDQENEIEFLKQSNVNFRQHKSALERDLKLLEELYQKREVELEAIKNDGKSVSSQLVDLRMVPKLFGIINF